MEVVCGKDTVVSDDVKDIYPWMFVKKDSEGWKKMMFFWQMVEE